MFLFCSYIKVIKYNIAEITIAQHVEFHMRVNISIIDLIKTGSFLNLSFFACLSAKQIALF
jgi:hypothetical protein